MQTWFFSYGSSADPKQFETEVGPIVKSVASSIPDHRLTFVNARAEWGGGTSCIVPAPGDEVIGTAYLLNEDQISKLEHADATYGFIGKKAHIEGMPADVKVLLPHE